MSRACRKGARTRCRDYPRPESGPSRRKKLTDDFWSASSELASRVPCGQLRPRHLHPAREFIRPGMDLLTIWTYIDWWQRLGACGAFGNKVHDMFLVKLDTANGVLLASGSAGTAGRSAVDALVSVLQELASDAGRIPIERIVIGSPPGGTYLVSDWPPRAISERGIARARSMYLERASSRLGAATEFRWPS